MNAISIAREIMRRVGLAGDALPSSLEAFVDSHLGPDRQLTYGSPDQRNRSPHHHVHAADRGACGDLESARRPLLAFFFFR